MKTHVTAAISKSRLPNSMQSKTDIEKLKLNQVKFWKYSDEKYSLILSIWKDKQLCNHISNYAFNLSINKSSSQKAVRREKRFNSLQMQSTQDMKEEEGEKKTIPSVVDDYSRYMKGVDLFNQSSSYYSFPHKSLKWYRPIFNWLMEIAIINSFKLYKHIIDDDLSLLNYRRAIIKEWEQEYINQAQESCEFSMDDEVPEEMQSEDDFASNFDHENNQTALLSQSIDQIQLEDECRLGLSGSKGDCDICSDRLIERKVTAYVCLNDNCIVEPARSDRSERYFRVHPECFHIHLRR